MGYEKPMALKRTSIIIGALVLVLVIVRIAVGIASTGSPREQLSAQRLASDMGHALLKTKSAAFFNVATQSGPAWPLPGLPASMTVTRQDFTAGFAGTQLAQIQQQGLFTRSNDPSQPQHLDQGVLLSVQGESPSAHVPFY